MTDATITLPDDFFGARCCATGCPVNGDKDFGIFTRSIVAKWRADSADLADRDRRIEALTKALEGTLSWLTSYPGGLPMTPGGAYDKARAALADDARARG